MKYPLFPILSPQLLPLQCTHTGILLVPISNLSAHPATFKSHATNALSYSPKHLLNIFIFNFNACKASIISTLKLVSFITDSILWIKKIQGKIPLCVFEEMNNLPGIIHRRGDKIWAEREKRLRCCCSLTPWSYKHALAAFFREHGTNKILVEYPKCLCVVV